MILEILIVIVLTLINGLLAMSELAVVSSRPARLKMMATEGRLGAKLALNLSENPGKFLSSVQIGITLVGVLSGAFSGATLGDRLGQTLIAWGLDAGLAAPLGVGIVVIIITYLSLIIGELVPKQIALRDPERIAARVAPLMAFIATAAARWSGCSKPRASSSSAFSARAGKAKSASPMKKCAPSLPRPRAPGCSRAKSGT